jgi:hypothetical protein
MCLGPSYILDITGHTRIRHHEEDHILADNASFATPSMQPKEEQDLISTPPQSKCQCYRAPCWAKPSHTKSSSRASSDPISKATRVYQKYATLPNQCLEPYSRIPAHAISPSFYRSASESSFSSYSTPNRSPWPSRSISRTSSSTSVESSISRWEDDTDDGVDEGVTSPHLPLLPFYLFIAFVLAMLLLMVYFVCMIVADLMEAFIAYGRLEV